MPRSAGPWIDWLHTARDQGKLVRDFIKWDDQPASLQAAGEAALRAQRIATTAPQGPVYLCFDVSLQEQACDPALPLPDPARFAQPVAAYPDPDAVQRVAQLLARAKRPVILAGRLSRHPDAWNRRVALAERLGATVITDLKQAAAFPTRHPLHVPFTVGQDGAQALRDADVILALDWLDPAGTVKVVGERGAAVTAAIVNCSPEQYSHRGWSMDHQALLKADLHFLCEPEALVDALLAADDASPRFQKQERQPVPPRVRKVDPAPSGDAALSIRVLAQVLRDTTKDILTSLIKVPLGWSNEVWDYDAPLDFLGKDGGAGIGSGPGMAIGAALALQGSGRLPLAVIGDGDFMFSASAFWTAARYPPAAPGRCRQQQYLFQRRDPPGTHRPPPRPHDREQGDRADHDGSRHRYPRDRPRARGACRPDRAHRGRAQCGHAGRDRTRSRGRVVCDRCPGPARLRVLTLSPE